MIVQNATGRDVRLRFNRHLKQEVLDIFINGEWCALGSIRQGAQSFPFGINAFTTLPRSPVRSDCDLLLGETVLTEGC